MASDGGTPGSKFAGGHRIRVTPVPIPNTEVKPDTADGTAWETVWESRSLPALFVGKPASFGSRAFALYAPSPPPSNPLVDSYQRRRLGDAHRKPHDANAQVIAGARRTRA